METPAPGVRTRSRDRRPRHARLQSLVQAGRSRRVQGPAPRRGSRRAGDSARPRAVRPRRPRLGWRRRLGLRDRPPRASPEARHRERAPSRDLRTRDPRESAQQTASRYMLVFRSSAAEQLLAANNYARLVEILSRDLGERFTATDRAAYLDAWAQPGALTGGLNYYRAAGVGPAGEGDPAHGVGGDASRLTVRVPTLVIWGEKDRALLTGNLDGLERFVPDLTIERIPEGSHWVVNEHPERVNRLIRAFLATGDSPDTKE